MRFVLLSSAASGTILRDASPDGRIERSVFCGSLLPPVLSLHLQPVAAMLITFRVAFPSHGALQLCIELPQQPFNARQALVAFNREMQSLALQRLVMGVEEGNHGRRVAEVAPGSLDQVALPPRLVGASAPGHCGVCEMGSTVDRVDRPPADRPPRAPSRDRPRRRWPGAECVAHEVNLVS